MTTPYARNLSMGYSHGYVQALVTRPLNSAQTPHAMISHQSGVLLGKGSNPPLFYPSQEPVHSDMNGIGRVQYARTYGYTTNPTNSDSKHNTPGQGQTSTTSHSTESYTSWSTQRHYPIRNTFHYIAPVDQSAQLERNKSIALGKGAYQSMVMTTKQDNPSYTKSRLQRVRSGGCTAPKKKGMIK